MHHALSPSPLTIAFLGNPNTGKSTVFSDLAGIHQHVGNYPGCTVEKKTGHMEHNGRAYELIDLPGLYSMSPRSSDEMVAVDVLLGGGVDHGPVDAVVCIADASNLRRHLYLVSQVLEIGLPTVLVLNMMDLAESQGVRPDVERLERQLGVPVVASQANRRVGIPELKETLGRLAGQKVPRPKTPLPDAFEQETEHLEAALERDMTAPAHQEHLLRFLAQRLLLDTAGYLQKRLLGIHSPEWNQRLADAKARLADAGCKIPEIETESRFAWVAHVIEGVVPPRKKTTHSASERIDRLLTHRVWGVLILIALMLGVFQAVFAGAKPITRWIDLAMHAGCKAVESVVPEGALQSLLVDGVLHGVGGILGFLPQIAILFFFIAILEDCGYMARAAFLMDKAMARVGLSGKSFLPMISSFACTVPGIMGARVVENERDRLATILVAPLLPCSARLPIYTLLIAAFIPAQAYLGGFVSLQGLTLIGLYALGLIAAMTMARLFKSTLLRGEPPLFLMELPRYKMPAIRIVAWRVIERGWLFLRCAGTLILAVSVLTWAAMYYPYGPKEPHRSILAQVGRIIEPVVKPLGWDWRIGCSVIASAPAREVVVATMGVVFAADEKNPEIDGEAEASLLQGELQRATWEGTDRPLFTVPVALSILVFFALCAQCAATLAVIRQETNGWRWPVFTFAYMTTLAYVAAWATYQFGTWVSS